MKVSEKLKKSIWNRCIESHTGKILIPSDIVVRVKKENPEMYLLKKYQIESKILNFLNSKT